jgi:FtsH-binding integral membrane protein
MYNPYTSNERAVAQPTTEASTIFLAKVFNWMAIGLGLTGLAAFLTVNSQAVLQIVFGNKMVFYGLIFGELGLVFYLSARIERISAGAATGLFVVYSILNGQLQPPFL